MAGHSERDPSTERTFSCTPSDRDSPAAATRRQPGDESNGPSVEFLLLFFAEVCWETAPGVVAVFCALASTGRSPCGWRCRCRCSVLCCGRWCCSAGVAAAPEPTGALGRLRQRTGEGPGPATRAMGLRRLPQKTKTQKESVETRCRRCRVLRPRSRVASPSHP